MSVSVEKFWSDIIVLLNNLEVPHNIRALSDSFEADRLVVAVYEEVSDTERLTTLVSIQYNLRVITFRSNNDIPTAGYYSVHDTVSEELYNDVVTCIANCIRL